MDSIQGPHNALTELSAGRFFNVPENNIRSSPPNVRAAGFWS